MKIFTEILKATLLSFILIVSYFSFIVQTNHCELMKIFTEILKATLLSFILIVYKCSY